MKRRKKFWRNIIPLGVTVSLVLVIWKIDTWTDREFQLEILEPINLLREPPQSYPAMNQEIGRLFPHEPVKVIRMGYGKDFRAWQVIGSNNQSGWFIESSKNVLVQNGNN